MSEKDKKKKMSENLKKSFDDMRDNRTQTIKSSAPAEFIEDLERKWEGEERITEKEKEQIRYQKKLLRSLKKKVFKFH